MGIGGAMAIAIVSALTTGVSLKDATTAAVALGLGLLAKQFNKSNSPSAMPVAQSVPSLPPDVAAPK